MTRLGILTMDDLPERARPVMGDYPELYAHLLIDQPLELVTFAAHRGELPATPTDCDGWLIGGSRRSVNDDIGWIRDTESFVRAAVAAEQPVVGICFGHQLVATALGGTVEEAAVGWQIGAVDYAVERPAPWFEGDSFTLVASHRDQVTELPADAELWSTAGGCPIAGMTVGQHVWTLQGHPEFTAEVASTLYESRIEAVGARRVEEARASLGRPLSTARVAGAIARFVARP